ncbi:MAG: hypothetical protein LBL81_02770 [Tannerella sp.]|jgi:hypothetical protein|nr:hypothetical protein [Tannerella sp.]
MKHLKVPYLPALDVLDLSSVNFLLESKGQRDYINQANWDTFPYKPIAVFDIARSDTALYLHYFVRGFSLKAEQTQDGSSVYLDSCVEFFMKKPGKNYYMNFEFNCIGTCDASRRLSRVEKFPLKEEEYALIRRHSSLPKMHIPTEDTGLHAWELSVSIPFGLMELDPLRMPEKIWANFYKCADGTSKPHYLSWSPVGTPQPDFHRPEFFGEIYF